MRTPQKTCRLRFGPDGPTFAISTRDELQRDPIRAHLLRARLAREDVWDETCGVPVQPVFCPDSRLSQDRVTVRCIDGAYHLPGCPCGDDQHVAQAAAEEPNYSAAMFHETPFRSQKTEESELLDYREDDAGEASRGFSGLANHLMAQSYYLRWTWLTKALFWRATPESAATTSIADAVSVVANSVKLGGALSIDEAAAADGGVFRWGFLKAQFSSWEAQFSRGRSIELPASPTWTLAGHRTQEVLRFSPAAFTEPGRVKARRGWRDGPCMWFAYGSRSGSLVSLTRAWFHPILPLGGQFVPVHSFEEAEEIPGFVTNAPEGTCFLKPPSAAVFNEMMDRIFRARGLRWTATRIYPDLVLVRGSTVRILEVPGFRDESYRKAFAVKDAYWRSLAEMHRFIEYTQPALLWAV